MDKEFIMVRGVGDMDGLPTFSMEFCPVASWSFYMWPVVRGLDCFYFIYHGSFYVLLL
jgi:hypothetical protein